MLVAVANRKGGAGKTTVAVALAEAGAKRWGSALLVDCDEAASAWRWHELAGAGAMAAQVVALPTADLARRLAAIAAGYPLVVLDCPPGHLDILAAALDVADVAALPLRASAADIDRLWPTAELAAELAVPALAVLTMTRARTLALGAALAALRAGRVKVAKTMFPNRETIARAFGEPVIEPLAGLGADLLRELARAVK